MSHKNPTFLLTILVVLGLALSVFPLAIMETASAADEVEEGANLHVNMKESNGLSSETKSDANDTGATQHVFADYDDFGAGRVNPRWVDVGIWSSASRDSDISLTKATMEFNLWYSIAGETTEAHCTFRFILILDGEEIVYVEGMDESPEANQIVEYWTLQTPNMSYTIPAASTLELKIRYKAFEDCDIYFDSTSHDSGFWMESDFCKIFGAEATQSQVTLEVYDAWGADWEEVIHFIEIEVGGSEPEGEYSITEGKTRKYNDTEYKTTIITWKLGFKAAKGDVVDINIVYNQADNKGSGLSIYFEVGMAGGTLADGDDDDSGGGIIIFAVVGVVVAGAVVGGFVFMKKKGEGEDDEDEDYVDEDHQEEDEMEYE